MGLVPLHHKPFRAVAFSLASALAFALAALSFRLASDTALESGLQTVLKIFFWERVFGFIVLLLTPGRTTTKNWQGNTGAALLVNAGSLLYFFALSGTVLAVAVTLSDSYSIFAAVFAALLLRKLPSLTSSAALLLAFVGAVLCTGLLNSGTQGESAGSPLGVVAALGAACSFGATAIWQRYLLSKGSSLRDILFFMYVCSIVPMGAYLAWTGSIMLPAPAMAFTAVTAVLTLTANACAVNAQRFGSVILVGSLVYAAGLFSVVLGTVVLGEQLALTTLVGMALIVAGGIGSTLSEARTQPVNGASGTVTAAGASS